MPRQRSTESTAVRSMPTSVSGPNVVAQNADAGVPGVVTSAVGVAFVSNALSPVFRWFVWSQPVRADVS